MIKFLWEIWEEFWGYLTTNFDPLRDTIDIVLVALGIYWLLLLLRGTRAVQILVGVIVLVMANVAADQLNLVTMQVILGKLSGPAVIIIVILFQHDIRRGLARVGRGLFRSVSDQQETQMLEEVVRAAQTLAERRVGALFVLERDTGLEDQIESGVALDSIVSKDLLVALFLNHSPLHDGAVVIQRGRLAQAGCILPLTLKGNLPEGVGTRHRAAVGITEETDAVVIVVSEETASISVVTNGEMVHGLDAARLRVALREALSDAPEPEIEDEEASNAQALDADGNGRSTEDSAAVKESDASITAASPEPHARSVN